MPSEVGVSLTKDYVDGFVLDSKYATECRGHELLVTMDMPCFPLE